MNAELLNDLPRAKPNGEGELCVLGLVGQMVDPNFPAVPDYHQANKLLNKLGLPGEHHQLLKEIVVANDAGDAERAWQLLALALVDHLRAPLRRSLLSDRLLSFGAGVLGYGVLYHLLYAGSNPAFTFPLVAACLMITLGCGFLMVGIHAGRSGR